MHSPGRHGRRLAGLTVQVRFVDGSAYGSRRADAVNSQVIVDAFRVSDFLTSAARSAIRDKTVVYILAGNGRAYVGRGGNERVLGQISRMGADFASQVYVIHTRDERAGKSVARYLEGRLIQAALEAGSALDNKAVGVARDVFDDINIDFGRALQEALLFLPAAGCSIFEARYAAPRVATENESLPDGYRIIPVSDFTPPDTAVRVRLQHPSLDCEAWRSPGRLAVTPGSDLAIKNIFNDSVGGLKQSNVRRYLAIRDRATGDIESSLRPSRSKLTCWVTFECPKVAARVLTCCHSTQVTWLPVKPDSGDAAAIEDGGQHGGL